MWTHVGLRVHFGFTSVGMPQQRGHFFMYWAICAGVFSDRRKHTEQLKIAPLGHANFSMFFSALADKATVFSRSVVAMSF